MYQTKKKSPAAHSLPQQFKPPMRDAAQSRPAVAQLKNGVSAQSVKSPVAPPVYRPQVKPVAAQAKMAGAAQMKTHPPTPAVYRPQPVPKVLQSKTAGAAVPQPPVASRATHVVQRSSDGSNKWATKVSATFNGLKANGASGKGQQTGQLLRATNTKAAQKFEAILQQVESSGYRTGFTCAEPNAVARLLADAKGPKTVDDLWKVKVTTAYDSTGSKDTCPVCSQWILNGTIIDLTNSGQAESDSGSMLTSVTLASVLDKATKGQSSSNSNVSSSSSSIVSTAPKPQPQAPMNYLSAVSKPLVAPKTVDNKTTAKVVDTTDTSQWPTLPPPKKKEDDKKG